MAAFVVDFVMNLYQSRVIDGVKDEKEALEFAEQLLEDDEFFYALCEDWRDHLRTDWLVDNIDVTVYGEAAGYECIETITKE